MADEVRTARPNVAGPVNRLVSAGPVRRGSDAAELRANLLHLAAEGTAARARIRRRVAEADTAPLQHLARDERAQFVRLPRGLLQR